MAYVASALRDKHSEDNLHILVAKTNSGNFTYDGIDLGAERVTKEIETYIGNLENEGCHVNKLSIVGYSLGGLVARYAIGLLYSNGWFKRIQPVNFTTFASPHLGVRTPGLGTSSQIWNFLGSRTLSTSGRQLFTIDNFRDTNRPLLSVLADLSSIFMLALAQFRCRVLYANIVNDRSAPYYTTSISKFDQFIDLDAVNINYLSDYSPIVVDPADPVSLKPPQTKPPLMSRLVGSSSALLTSVPLYALFCVMIPIGSIVFLINAGVQSVRSQQRIKLHEQGQASINTDSYRIPLLVDNARHTMERAYESINAGQRQQYLPIADRDSDSDTSDSQDSYLEKAARRSSGSNLRRTSSRRDDFPTLALTSEQFAMIDALDEIGFLKFRVHIHNVRHSHAAIIVRAHRRGWLDEGKTVIRHWLDTQFEV